MRIDLVVSAYKDSLGWVQELAERNPQVRVCLYDKSDTPIDQKWPGGVHLDNRGKCDATYLHHIVEHYYGLADWTVFSTDYPFDGLKPGQTMDGVLAPGPDVVCPWVCKAKDWGPDNRIDWASMTNRPDRNGTNWAERFASGKITPAKRSFTEWAERNFGFSDWSNWPGYHPGSVYGVPKQAIAYLPRIVYASLREQLSHSVEPEEGHYMERLWLVVFTGQARYEVQDAGDKPELAGA